MIAGLIRGLFLSIWGLPLRIHLGLVSVLFTLACIHYFYGHYTVNDNLGIVDFVTGGYPIPYVGITFSSLLHLAYVMPSAVPWLGLAPYALQTFGLWLCLMLGWRVFRFEQTLCATTPTQH